MTTMHVIAMTIVSAVPLITKPWLLAGSEEVLMPFRYTLACDDPRFVFDSLLAVGALA